MSQQQSDVIIVGSGAVGVAASIEAKEAGVKSELPA